MQKVHGISYRRGVLVRFVRYLADGTQVWKAVRGKEIFNISGIGAATWGPKAGDRGRVTMQSGTSFHLPFVARA